MKLQQVSDNCFAVLNEKNLVCDANSGLINLSGGVVVFAGNVIFRECTPMGWNGTYEKWIQVLDLIISLDPDVIVPGYGPVCGIEDAMEMKAYLECVREESKRFFGHRRLQVDRQRQRAHRRAHGRVHGHARVRLVPDDRGHATTEERVGGATRTVDALGIVEA